MCSMRYSMTIYLLLLVSIAHGATIGNSNRANTLSAEDNLIQLHSAFKNLRKGQYGSLIFDMISLHVQTRGPLDFLMETIRSLGKDQVERYKSEEERFKNRSNLHTELINDYNLALSRSTLEIKNNKNILENDLKPLFVSITQSIRRLKIELEDNDSNFKKVKSDREQQIKVFNQKSNDYLELQEMVEKALDFMNELLQAEKINTETTLSLLQVNVKKARLEISKIVNKFNDFHGLYAPFAVALSEVTVMKNRDMFADQKMVTKIVELLSQLKLNFEENFTSLKETEETNSRTFNDLELQYNSEKNIYEQKLKDEDTALKMVKEDIDQKENILQINEAELIRNKKLLDVENEAFEEEAGQWEIKSEKILEEIQVCKEALVIINSEGVRNYVLGESFKN